MATTMAAKGNSLRDRQIGPLFLGVCALFGRVLFLLTAPIASIKKILNLNDSLEPSENEDSHTNGVLASSTPILTAEGEPIWKVLVFDDLGRDVISSVLRVSDLRAMGITMHMSVAFYTWPLVPSPYILTPE